MQLDLVDEDIYENDELKHWGIEGMNWSIKRFDDEDILIHYRTPGSKNGIRKYQYPDGRLTPLGKIHYELIGKNECAYYDPKYKAKFYDIYGKEKQQELNEYKNQIGNKAYKGYEQAEMQDAYKKPGKSSYEIKNDKSKERNNRSMKRMVVNDIVTATPEATINKAKQIKAVFLDEPEHVQQATDTIVQNNYNKAINQVVNNTDINDINNFLLDTEDFLRHPLEWLLKKAYNKIKNK